MSSTTPNTTKFQFVLRKKKGRTMVTEIFVGDYETHAQAIDHLWTGWGHYRKAKRWLKKNGLEYTEL